MADVSPGHLQLLLRATAVGARGTPSRVPVWGSCQGCVKSQVVLPSWVAKAGGEGQLWTSTNLGIAAVLSNRKFCI